jgi:hypothetical protein
MLTTDRATVYVVAGVYQGRVSEEVSHTRKMVYVKLRGSQAAVRLMQSSVKVMLEHERPIPVRDDAPKDPHAGRQFAIHQLVDVCRGTYRGTVGRVVACTPFMVYLHFSASDRTIRLLKTSVLEVMEPDGSNAAATSDGEQRAEAAAAA